MTSSLFHALGRVAERDGVRHLLCLLNVVVYSALAGSDLGHHMTRGVIEATVSTVFALPLAYHFGAEDA